VPVHVPAQRGAACATSSNATSSAAGDPREGLGQLKPVGAFRRHRHAAGKRVGNQLTLGPAAALCFLASGVRSVEIRARTRARDSWILLGRRLPPAPLISGWFGAAVRTPAAVAAQVSDFDVDRTQRGCASQVLLHASVWGLQTTTPNTQQSWRRHGVGSSARMSGARMPGPQCMSYYSWRRRAAMGLPRCVWVRINERRASAFRKRA